MYELILQLVLMLSLAVIVYLMAVAVPRVGDIETTKNGNGSTSLPLERIDLFLSSLKDKLLRRLKVLVMKADNLISRQLNNKKEEL